MIWILHNYLWLILAKVLLLHVSMQEIIVNILKLLIFRLDFERRPARVSRRWDGSACQKSGQWPRWERDLIQGYLKVVARADKVAIIVTRLAVGLA